MPADDIVMLVEQLGLPGGMAVLFMVFIGMHLRAEFKKPDPVAELRKDIRDISNRLSRLEGRLDGR